MNTEFATAISRQMDTGFGQQYHLSINAMQQAAFYLTSSTKLAYLTSPSTMPLQTWIHLAGTWDGSEARLYVNGTEVATAQVGGPLAAETNPVVLGDGNGASRTVSELVPGRLDDVMLYRRALAADRDRPPGERHPLLPAAIVRSDGGWPLTSGLASRSRSYGWVPEPSVSRR